MVSLDDALDDDRDPVTVAEQTLDTAAARLAGEATGAYYAGLTDAMRGRRKGERLHRWEVRDLTETFLEHYLDDHAPGGVDA